MAKSKEKRKALKLRQGGESVRVIADKLGISRSTASLWCRDIVLSSSQICNLDNRVKRGSYKGRLKVAKYLHEKRLQRERFLEQEGKIMISRLTKKDRFILGLGLYMGEGHKKGHRVGFTSSDPNLIRFMITWFEEFWGVKRDQFIMWISINEIHQGRERAIVRYWKKVTSIPEKQFRKIYFKKVLLKKEYENHFKHFGTVQLRIRSSKDMLYKIIGSIRGIVDNTAG